MQFSKKKRLPRLIIDFKSKKMMKEFVKDATKAWKGRKKSYEKYMGEHLKK